MAKSTFRIEWDAHEYEHKERTQDWFWTAGIIAFSLAVVSIIFGNIIFGILIILSAFSLSLFINRPPENIHISVSELGVSRGNVLYPYETLHSFWIDELHPHKKILIRSNKKFMPLIIAPLGPGTDIEKVRDTLNDRLPEEHLSLPLMEYILEYLGF